jgi:hypothetical protein
MKAIIQGKMINEDRMAILEEETLILRDSGEIPEIAFHSTLHYLTVDKDGPAMLLSAEELRMLQDAALHRCREIVMRDLDPANRDLGLYRGLCRTIYNWQRMQDFCKRIGRDCSSFKETVGPGLIRFLQQELLDVQNGSRTSSVNCSAARLIDFAASLDLPVDALPAGWQDLCPSGRFIPEN